MPKYTSVNPLVVDIDGGNYYIWEDDYRFRGSFINPGTYIMDAHQINNFGKAHGFATINDVVSYVKQYFKNN